MTRNNSYNVTRNSGVVSSNKKQNNVLTVHSTLPRTKDLEREKEQERIRTQAKAEVQRNKQLKAEMGTYHKLQTTSNSRGNMDMGVENIDSNVANKEKNRLMKKYNVSSEDFDKEYSSYSSQKNREAIRGNQKKAEKFAKEHPVLGSLKSIGNGLLSSAEGVANTAALLQGGKLDAEKDYISSNKRDAQREGASSNIKSNAGKTAYNLGMSAADMAAQMALAAATGGGGAVMGTVQGAQTAGDMSKKSLKRGNSSLQAGLTGLGGGLVTAGLTKFGVDDVLGNQSSTVLGGLLRGARNEGLEEAGENIAYSLIDQGVANMLGGKSAKDEALRQYRLQGMTNEQAEEQFKKDRTLEVLQDAGAGALFGGVLGGGRNAIGHIKGYNANLNKVLQGEVLSGAENYVPTKSETKVDNVQQNKVDVLDPKTVNQPTTTESPRVEGTVNENVNNVPKAITRPENKGTGISRKDTDNIIFRTSKNMNGRGTIQTIDDIVENALGREGKASTSSERARLKKAVREFAEQGNTETLNELNEAMEAIASKLPETNSDKGWATSTELRAQIQSIIDTPEIASNLAVENMKQVVYDPNTSVDEKVNAVMEVVNGGNQDIIGSKYMDDIRQAMDYTRQINGSPTSSQTPSENMMFSLWNKPVSDDFQNTVDALNRGDIDNQEANNILFNTPEIKEGFRIKDEAWKNLREQYNLADTTDALAAGTSGINAEERAAVRQKVTDDIMARGSATFKTVDGKRKVSYDGPVRNDRRLDIVIGLPASGKSSAIVDDLSATYGSRLHDNDEIKQLIPEFNDGWGAGLVHEESSEISDTLLDLSLERGENIVLPKVGSLKKSNPAKETSIERFIKDAKDHGYEVYVHNVELPRNKAKARMMSRFADKGRFFSPDMPDAYFDEAGNSLIDAQYERLKQGDLIDGYSKWNNDVPKGANPELIESNIAGDEFRSLVSNKTNRGNDSGSSSILRGYSGADIGNNGNIGLGQELQESSERVGKEAIRREVEPSNGAERTNNVTTRSDILLNPKNINANAQPQNARPRTVNTNDLGTGKERLRSYPQSMDMPEEFKAEFDKATYNQLKNKETVERATNILNTAKSLDDARTQFRDMVSNHEAASVPLGYELAKQYIDNGERDTAIDIINEISLNMTRAGQFTQAAYITALKNDPMTVLRAMEKELEKINKDGAAKFGAKWKQMSLTNEEIDALRNATAGDTNALTQITDDIYSRLSKDYPHTTWEKFYDLTKTAMLLNPRTHIRNVVANAITMPTRSLTDRVKFLMESGYSMVNKDYKVTSSALGGDKKLKEVAGKYFDDFIKNTLDDNKWAEKGTGRLAKESQMWTDSSIGTAVNEANSTVLNSLNRITNGKLDEIVKAYDNSGTNSVLENLRRFDYWLLGDVEDVPFVKQNFVNSLSNYMKATGSTKVDDIPAEAVQMALDEALKATFKDDNTFTKALSGIKKSTGKFGDIVLPFTKTPANLAMRGIDYSPVGFVNSFRDLAKTKAAKNGTLSNADISSFIGDLSKNVTGTAMIFLGYQLAKKGVITGSESEDKDQRLFNSMGGYKANAFHINGKYYTYDWSQPSSIPLLIGTAIYEGSQNDDKKNSQAASMAKSLKNGMLKAGESWLELSPLQSIFEIINGSGQYDNRTIPERALDKVLEYPQTLIPSVAGATARTIDPTMRNTYDRTSEFNTWVNQAKAKIPGLSKDLPASYDTWGRERQRSKDSKSAAFAQFLNPGTYGYDNSSPIDKEINRLFESTGDNGVFPQASKYTVTGKDADGNDINVTLDNKAYSALQKEQGERSYQLANEFINSDAYKSMSDSERVEVLKNIYKSAKNTAESNQYGIVKDIPKAEKEAYESGKYLDYLVDKNNAKKYDVDYDEYQKYMEEGGTEAVEQYVKDRNDLKALKDEYDVNISVKDYQKTMKKGGQQAVDQLVQDKINLKAINDEYDIDMNISEYQKAMKKGGEELVQEKAMIKAGVQRLNDDYDVEVSADQYKKWASMGATKDDMVFMGKLKSSVSDMKEEGMGEGLATVSYLAGQNISDEERSKYILMNSTEKDWNTGYKARGIKTFGESAAYKIVANREIAKEYFDADGNGNLKQSEIKAFVNATYSDPNERARWYYVLTGKNY